MTALKSSIINSIIDVEGGYVNDPSDSGGATKYGITKKVARANGYKGKMRNLPQLFAFSVYSKKYWDKLHLDEMELLAPKTTEKLANVGVNMGTGRAAKFLQRALNVLNQRGKLYPDLKVDGQVGNQTVKALRKYIRRRGSKGDKVLFKIINSLQGTFYVKLAERRVKDERFIFGWFSNRVS